MPRWRMREGGQDGELEPTAQGVAVHAKAGDAGGHARREDDLWFLAPPLRLVVHCGKIGLESLFVAGEDPGHEAPERGTVCSFDHALVVLNGHWRHFCTVPMLGEAGCAQHLSEQRKLRCWRRENVIG